MGKPIHIWYENVQNNIFKISTPLPSFLGGQKGLKFEKNTFFQQNQFLERERWVVPLFFITDSERGIIGREITQKKSWGLQVGKKVTVVLKNFFEKKGNFFSGILKFDN